MIGLTREGGVHFHSPQIHVVTSFTVVDLIRDCNVVFKDKLYEL